MEKNQNDKRNPDKTGNQSNQKTNEDYNKKQPDPNDPNEIKRNPNTKVPYIGDDNKEIMKNEILDDTTVQKNDVRNNDDQNKETNGDKTP
jgi:hypothetical protein